MRGGVRIDACGGGYNWRVRWCGTASGGGGRRWRTVIEETEQFVLDIDFDAGGLHIGLHGLYQLCDGEVDVEVHLNFRLLYLDDDGGGLGGKIFEFLFESNSGSDRGCCCKRWGSGRGMEGGGRMGLFEASGGRGHLIELLEKPLVRIFLVKLGFLVRFL